VLLIVCIIFKLLPVIPQNWNIIKAAVPAGKNINLGTDGINTSDTVYYASNSGTSYGWRVVSKDESSMTLFSNAEIGEKKVYDISHPDGTYLGTHQNWSDSDICNYLNGTFLDTYFTDIEKSDAAISSYSNHVEYGYNLTDTFIPNQKIVLPSVEK
jgi:hypothetical protein